MNTDFKRIFSKKTKKFMEGFNLMGISVCLGLVSGAPKSEFKQSGSKEMQRLDDILCRSIRYF